MKREMIVTIDIHKPWWTHVAFFAAKVVVRLGYPLDIDAFSRRLAGAFKVSVREGPVRTLP